MPTLEVFLTQGAEEDLRAIHRYLAHNDSMERADRLHEARSPRNSRPSGFANTEVVLGAYRIIYRVLDHRIIVYVIADGRRDMQSLLKRRLLRS